MPLSEQDKKAVEKAKQNPQSIYRSLHHVGDDTVKADIEEALRELLPPEHFLTVLAVFQVGTRGTIYRKGGTVQIQWDRHGRETWVLPDSEWGIAQAKANFDRFVAELS